MQCSFWGICVLTHLPEMVFPFYYVKCCLLIWWFCRGEDGELRLGIRRAGRPKNGLPNSTLGNHNMHLNVLSPVANAISTKTMFHVFYSPRYCYKLSSGKITLGNVFKIIVLLVVLLSLMTSTPVTDTKLTIVNLENKYDIRMDHIFLKLKHVFYHP